MDLSAFRLAYLAYSLWEALRIRAGLITTPGALVILYDMTSGLAVFAGGHAGLGLKNTGEIVFIGKA